MGIIAEPKPLQRPTALDNTDLNCVSPFLQEHDGLQGDPSIPVSSLRYVTDVSMFYTVVHANELEGSPSSWR